MSYRYDYTKTGRPKTRYINGKAALRYTYTKAGRIASITDICGKTTAYGYDLNGRLASVSEQGKVLAAYTYDAAGNRIQKQTQSYVEDYLYDERNRLTQKSVKNNTINSPTNPYLQEAAPEAITTYQYDLQGSLTKEQSADFCKQYLYNDFHQCIQTDVIRGREADAERLVQQNLYDGEGLRFAIIENGNRTGFITDGWDNVTELDGNGRVRKRIIRGMGIIASEDTEQKEDNIFTTAYHYYHGNERMDVEYITDESGNVVNSYTYDAFGGIISSNETIPNRYTYNGEAYDKTTEQYYLRKRYYNPKLCRFTQEDEYRGDGLNLYAFCANNPVMYVDPSGYSQVFPSDIYPPETDVDIYVDPGRVSYDKAQEKRNAMGIVTGNFTAGVHQDGSIISADLTKITIPQDVAIAMKGNKYNSFNEFRADFWKTMSQSPTVRNEFSSSDLWAMEQGYAPRVHNRDLYSKVFGKKYNIDHVIEIQDGGYVFDLDNMSILAPKTHEEKTAEERRTRKCDS